MNYAAILAGETKAAKAARGAAKAGLPGSAVNSPTEENLVGQVPKRGKKKRGTGI